MSNSHWCRSKALFCAQEATPLLLVHRAHSAFLTRLNFPLHEPMFLLEAPNVLLHTLHGIQSSHCLVPTLVWSGSSQGFTLLARESTTAVILAAWPPSTQTWAWSSWLNLSIMRFNLYDITHNWRFMEREHYFPYIFCRLTKERKKKSIRTLNLRWNMNISSKNANWKNPMLLLFYTEIPALASTLDKVIFPICHVLLKT